MEHTRARLHASGFSGFAARQLRGNLKYARANVRRRLPTFLAFHRHFERGGGLRVQRERARATSTRMRRPANARASCIRVRSVLPVPAAAVAAAIQLGGGRRSTPRCGRVCERLQAAAVGVGAFDERKNDRSRRRHAPHCSFFFLLRFGELVFVGFQTGERLVGVCVYANACACWSSPHFLLLRWLEKCAPRAASLANARWPLRRASLAAARCRLGTSNRRTGNANATTVGGGRRLVGKHRARLQTVIVSKRRPSANAASASERRRLFVVVNFKERRAHESQF